MKLVVVSNHLTGLFHATHVFFNLERYGVPVASVLRGFGVELLIPPYCASAPAADHF